MEEDTECGNEILCTLISKKCALLSVQKIIDSKPYGINDHIYYSTKSYWETVAKEIEDF